MALGNYGKALGDMARESVSGAVKGFGLGIKSAALREMPGFTALYGFSKELKGRAGKMDSGAAEVVKEQRANNVISLEMVRQLRSINQNVLSQTRLLNYQASSERQRQMFAEEVEREKEKRDKDLIDAIRGLKGGLGGGGTAANDSSMGGGGILGAIGNLLGGILNSPAGLAGAGLLAGRKLLRGAGSKIGGVVGGAASRMPKLGGAGRGLAMGGRILGRAIPYVGWGLLAYELYQAFSELFGSQGGQSSRYAGGEPYSRQGLYGQARAAGLRPGGAPAGSRAGVASGDIVDRIIQAESGGKNISTQIKGSDGRPTSSAFGIGQVTRGTFEGVMARAKPGDPIYEYENSKTLPPMRRGNNKTFEQFKQDVAFQRIFLNALVAANSKDLQRRGIATNDANIYLAHFLGAGGASRVLSAKDDTPLANVLSGDVIKANPQLLKIGTVGNLKKWAAEKMGGGGGGQPPTTATAGGGGGGKKTLPYGAGPAQQRPGAFTVASTSTSGTEVVGKDGKVAVKDTDAVEVAKKQLESQKRLEKSGARTETSMRALVGTQNATRPRRKSIIERANETFLNQFQSTTARLLGKAIYDSVVVGAYGKQGSRNLVSRQQASGEMFRGQQIAQITGLRKNTSKLLTNLFGKDIANAYAPMLTQLGTAYLEVGARFAGRGLFGGAGFSDKDSDALTGQILGNFARGNKQAATEQLLYGMTGVASGPESIFFKYGFNSSQQGANFLGQMGAAYATAPIAGMLGSEAPRTYRDPRTGRLYATDVGPQMGGGFGTNPIGYGTNNPYLSAASINNRTLNDKALTVAERAQVAEGLLGRGEDSAKIAEQLGGINKNTLDQLQSSKKQFEDSQKVFLEAQAKQREFERGSQEWQDANRQSDEAKRVMDDAMREQDLRRNDLLREISAKTGRTGVGGGTAGPGGEFLSSLGNFAWDLGTSMVASKLTSGIKNPYMRAFANFALVKGANTFVRPMVFGGAGGAGGIGAAFASQGGFGGLGSAAAQSFGFGGGEALGLSGYAANMFANMGMPTASNFFAGMNAASTAGLTTAGTMGYYANQALPYASSIIRLVQGDVKGAALSAAGTFIGNLILPGIGGFIGGFIGGLFGGGSSRRPTPYVERALRVGGNNDIGQKATVASGDNPPEAFTTFADRFLTVAFNTVKLMQQVSGVNPPFAIVGVRCHVDDLQLRLYEESQAPGQDAPKWKFSYGKPSDANGGQIAAKMVEDIKGVIQSGKSQQQIDAVQKAADRLKGKTFNNLATGLVTELTSGPLSIDTSLSGGLYSSSAEVNALVEQYKKDLSGRYAPQVGYDENGPSSRQIWSYKDNGWVTNDDSSVIGIDKNGKPIYNYANQSTDFTRGNDSITSSDLQKHIREYYPDVASYGTITPTDGTINTNALTYTPATGGPAAGRAGAVNANTVVNSGNQTNDNSTTVNNFSTISSSDPWRMNGTNTGYVPG